MGAFIYKPLLYCYIMLGAIGTVTTANNKSLIAFGPSLRLTSPAKTFFHPIHVSTSNIEYNKQTGKLEVICTIFTDDFEAALVKQYKAKTDLNKTDMHTAMDALIKNYIAANLKINADNTPVNLNYLGFEINREATDVYLESDKIPPLKKVDVDVSLLYNLFDDEINIVHITVNGVRKSEKINYPYRGVEQVF